MSFTQSDADALRRSESLLHQSDLNDHARTEKAANAVTDVSRRLYPSYVIKAFRYMVSYVLQYYANVLHTEEAAIWEAVLNMSDDVTHGGLVGSNEAAQMDENNTTNAREQHKQHRRYRWAMEDVLLRLACRKPDWFSVARLHDTYADTMSALIARHARADDDMAANDEQASKSAKASTVGVDDGASASKVEGFEEDTPMPIHTLAQLLASRPVHALDGASMVSLMSGMDVAVIFARKDKTLAISIMSCLSRYSLREIALLLAQNNPVVQSYLAAQPHASDGAGNSAEQGPPTESAATATRGAAQTNHMPGPKKSSTRLTGKGKGVPGAGGGDVSLIEPTKPMSARSASSIPDTKPALVEFVFEAGSQDTQFPFIWDQTVGPVLRVHPRVKESLRLLMSLFHVVTEYFPTTSGGGGGGAQSQGGAGIATQSPLPSSNIAVLVTLGNVRLPMMRTLPLFSFEDLAESIATKLARSSTSSSGSSDGVLMRNSSSCLLQPMPPSLFRSGLDDGCRLLLFSHRTDLDLYMEGLHLSAELFDVCEGYGRQKMRDVQWTATILARIQKAFAVIKRLQAFRQVEAANAESRNLHNVTRRPGGRSAKKRERDDDSGHLEQVSNATTPHVDWIGVPQALQRYGFQAYHLTRFLPLHVWMRCVEYLVEVLAMQRRYEECNVWLKVLTEYPVFQVCAPTPASTSSATTTTSATPVFRMYYRYQARGRWLHRIGLNLVHLGHQAQALKLMETCLEASGSLSRSALAQQEALLAIAERTHRLMRHVGDYVDRRQQRDGACVGVGWSRESCAYHAAMQHQQEHFLRRSDRMTMERLLVRLHKPPRRWCALPAHLLITTVKEARPLYLNGHRDSLGGGWNDEALSKTSCSVEAHVLRWFVERGRGRREKGWHGIHCEGGWIDALTRVVFAEAFTWHPLLSDGDEQQRHQHVLTPTAPFLWLSSFQGEPLDAHDILNFVERRRQVLLQCIRAIEGMSQGEFVEFVKARTFFPAAVNDADIVEGGPDRRDTHDGDNAATDVAGPTAQDAEVEELGEADQVDAHASRTSEADNSEVALLSDHDDVQDVDDRLSNASTGSHAANDHVTLHQEDLQESCPPCRGKSDAQEPPPTGKHLVNISGIPQLRDMAQCIPIKPLCRLYEEMFLSAPSEGHVIRFSGWPDLVVWRISPTSTETPDGVQQRSNAHQFCLVEVKSPNDKLSEKQIAVNDMLIRSGFDVAVGCVVDKQVIESTKAPRARMSQRYEHQVAQVQLTKRNSSSFVRGTATNPVEL